MYKKQNNMKFSIVLSFISLIVMQMISDSESMIGSVVLDSITFDKIVSKFKTSLVKFDIQYPYGDKHEEYEKVVKLVSNSDVLMAEVGVQEYGDKENGDLAQRYGISRDDFPVLKLFVDGKVDSGIHFDEEFKSDAMIRFIRRHSGIRIPLNMCLEEFDEIAERFMDPKITEEKRKEILNEAKQQLSQLSNEEHRKWADIYVKLMDKVVERGNQFIESETQRVGSMVSGKLSESKKNELKGRLNILLSFSTNSSKSDNSHKSEL